MLLRPLALILDDLYPNPSLMGIQQGFKMPLIPCSFFGLFPE